MTDIRKPIYNILSNNAAVAAIVGEKIYPLRAPQPEVAPYITYSIIHTNPSRTKAYGNASGASELDEVSIQINCVQTRYSSAITLAEAVRDALDRAGEANYFGVTIQSIDFDGHQDTFDEDVNLYISHDEYTIRVKKTPVSLRLVNLNDEFLLTIGDTYMRAVA